MKYIQKYYYVYLCVILYIFQIIEDSEDRLTDDEVNSLLQVIANFLGEDEQDGQHNCKTILTEQIFEKNFLYFMYILFILNKNGNDIILNTLCK